MVFFRGETRDAEMGFLRLKTLLSWGVVRRKWMEETFLPCGYMELLMEDILHQLIW